MSVWNFEEEVRSKFYSLLYQLEDSFTIESSWNSRFHSSTGFSSQSLKITGSSRWLKEFRRSLWPSVVVLCLDMSSTMTLSHEETLGRWTTWMTVSKYAEITWIHLSRIDADQSSTTCLLSQPKMQAMLFIFITTYCLLSCLVGWSDFRIFAIFENGHIAMDWLDWLNFYEFNSKKSSNFATCARDAHAAKF